MRRWNIYPVYMYHVFVTICLARCIFIVRRINKLGFRSKSLLESGAAKVSGVEIASQIASHFAFRR